MSNIKLFESKQISSSWNEDEEKWYFSIIDIREVLTESPNAKNYWKVLKHGLIKEGNQSVTNCNQLKNKVLREISNLKVTICDLKI